MAPVSKPITTAPKGPTKAHAGVMPTSPASAPEAAPNAVGRPCMIFSLSNQPTIPAQAATMVASITTPAPSLAASPDPTLKPNQPTHSMPAPTRVKPRLWGGIATCG